MSEQVSQPNTEQSSNGGFSFDNVHRNQTLLSGNKKNGTDVTDSASPSTASFKATKTGTTIVGMVYKTGVVLGADTRATGGTEVVERNCEKIHYIAPNIYCCGAGTAADTEQTTALISSQLELLRMNTHSQSRVVTACTLLKRMLFRYQGHVSAALILGGCDAVTGPSVYQIYPHGSTGKLPYTTMGSGSLAAMSVFETGWHEDMSEADAVKLVERAIGAGIFNDLGSGSNVDVCILRMTDDEKKETQVEYRRNAVKPNQLAPLRATVQHSSRLTMQPGVTPVLSTQYRPHPVGRPGMATLADVTVTEMEVES